MLSVPAVLKLARHCGIASDSRLKILVSGHTVPISCWVQRSAKCHVTSFIQIADWSATLYDLTRPTVCGARNTSKGASDEMI